MYEFRNGILIVKDAIVRSLSSGDAKSENTQYDCVLVTTKTPSEFEGACKRLFAEAARANLVSAKCPKYLEQTHKNRSCPIHDETSVALDKFIFRLSWIVRHLTRRLVLRRATRIAIQLVVAVHRRHVARSNSAH